MNGIFFGLLGAGFIGISDCIARVTARKVSLSLLFAAVMGLSTIALTIYLALSGDWPRWQLYGWGVSFLSGLLNLCALFFLYRALARGPVSIASPAASVFAVVLVGLNVLAGAPFVWTQGVATLLVFLGVAMLARRANTGESYDAAHLRLTAVLGLAAGVTVALRMFLAQEAGDALGALTALYLNRLFALAGALGMIGWEIAKGRTLHLPDRRMGRLVFFQSLFEMLALASFLFGSVGGGRIGASIGFAGFSAVTAIAAWLWLGEPIGLRRALWMSVVGVGIVLAVAAH